MSAADPLIPDPRSPIPDRKRAELEFHNRRAQAREQYATEEFERIYSNKKLYSIARRTKHELAAWMAAHAPGATALDYCCGQGVGSIELARHGATVYGIDIADEEVAAAARAAAAAGYAERTHFRVMDAERMTFPDSMFDLIVCNGVLHHLDVGQAFPELARVLKPGGRIMCLEALGYNPAIQLYRRLTPHLRTAWEAQHILTLREVRRAAPYFGTVRVRYFYLFSILAVPLRKTRLFDPMLRVLEAIDGVVLRIPLVRLMAWHMMFELSAPTKPTRGPADTGRHM